MKKKKRYPPLLTLLFKNLPKTQIFALSSKSATTHYLNSSLAPPPAHLLCVPFSASLLPFVSLRPQWSGCGVEGWERRPFVMDGACVDTRGEVVEVRTQGRGKIGRSMREMDWGWEWRKIGSSATILRKWKILGHFWSLEKLKKKIGDERRGI